MKYIELGKGVLISESAYSTVVYYAICEIDDVIFSKISKKEITERQLRQIVNLNIEEGQVEITVSVELCYGCNLDEVSKKIQKNIDEIVEQSTGYRPSCVNVNVTSISVC